MVEGGDLRRDQPENGAVTIGLLEKVTAKTRALIHLVGEIEVAAFFKNLPTLRTTNLAQHSRSLIAGHRFRPDRHYISVPPHLRRLPLADVEIGTALFYDHGEELVYVSHGQMTKYE